MATHNARLYYDASCGFCRREIEHLRPRLEPEVQLVDISAQYFQLPQGYSLENLLTRIHFFDGQTMHIGFNASLAYWRVAGMKKTVALLSLPGIRHMGHLIYNLWAKWRRRHSSRCETN